MIHMNLVYKSACLFFFYIGSVLLCLNFFFSTVFPQTSQPETVLNICYFVLSIFLLHITCTILSQKVKDYIMKKNCFFRVSDPTLCTNEYKWVIACGAHKQTCASLMSAKQYHSTMTPLHALTAAPLSQNPCLKWFYFSLNRMNLAYLVNEKL